MKLRAIFIVLLSTMSINLSASYFSKHRKEIRILLRDINAYLYNENVYKHVIGMRSFSGTISEEFLTTLRRDISTYNLIDSSSKSLTIEEEDAAIVFLNNLLKRVYLFHEIVGTNLGQLTPSFLLTTHLQARANNIEVHHKEIQTKINRLNHIYLKSL